MCVCVCVRACGVRVCVPVRACMHVCEVVSTIKSRRRTNVKMLNGTIVEVITYVRKLEQCLVGLVYV